MTEVKILGTAPVVPMDVTVSMTLRDYFAAQAMQAQVGNPLKLGDDEAHRLIAERAYRMADAMMKKREGK